MLASITRHLLAPAVLVVEFTLTAYTAKGWQHYLLVPPTEWLRLEVTLGGQLVQPSCSGRADQNQLHRSMSRELLIISRATHASARLPSQ